ncbi:MAG: FtsW/RodA/SpoVE family cell cycle protein, partial [Lentisphaeria bacterium]|nr:FtsW/RodA/SpoVE family cell cycle protein [Lentisphaeria bacterium]
YRVRRLFAFVDPWASPLDEGYQLIQSYYALGSGGLFGVGLGNSRQKYLFLHDSYIFCRFSKL